MSNQSKAKAQSRVNLLIIGDTQYSLDKPYREGAQAMRNSVPYSCNPYKHLSTAHEQWNYGHEHESVGFHRQNGQDILAHKRTGQVIHVEFEMVPQAA